MAEVAVTLDTVTCAMTVTLDGKEIPDVVDVSMYRAIDDAGKPSYQYMRFSTRKKVSDNVYQLVDYYSSASPEATAALQKGEAVSSEYPGFVAVQGKSKAQKDIENYFSKKLY